jgi:hypothetical protein
MKPGSQFDENDVEKYSAGSEGTGAIGAWSDVLKPTDVRFGFASSGSGFFSDALSGAELIIGVVAVAVLLNSIFSPHLMRNNFEPLKK